MQLPGAAQSPPGVQPAAGGNAPMTRTACIDAANPIPAEAQCKLDQVDRRGSARYVGDDLQLTPRPDPLRRVGALRRRHDGGDLDGARSGPQRPAGRHPRPYNRALSRTVRRKIAGVLCGC